jgi:methionyl-tRNA synthetase
MIMLHPFAPFTMNKLRQSLNLPKEVFCIDQLGIAISSGHVIGEQQQYFDAVED